MTTISQPSVQTVQRSLVVNADAKKVSSLIEDVARTPEWQPIFTRVTPPTQGILGPGSELECEALAVGKKLTPTCHILKWNSGNEYTWRLREPDTGQTMDGGILLNPRDGQTEVTMWLSYSLAGEVALVLSSAGFISFLSNALDQALFNLNRKVVAP
jgi:Polyketide cyclase / dehydrase and lipid transport